MKRGLGERGQGGKLAAVQEQCHRSTHVHTDTYLSLDPKDVIEVPLRQVLVLFVCLFVWSRMHVGKRVQASAWGDGVVGTLSRGEGSTTLAILGLKNANRQGGFAAVLAWSWLELQRSSSSSTCGLLQVQCLEWECDAGT